MTTLEDLSVNPAYDAGTTATAHARELLDRAGELLSIGKHPTADRFPVQ